MARYAPKYQSLLFSNTNWVLRKLQLTTTLQGAQLHSNFGPNRILFVNHASQLSGGEIALLNLVRELDSSRYKPVVLLLSQGPLVEKLHAAGIETHTCLMPSKILNTRKETLGTVNRLNPSEVFSIANYMVLLIKTIKGLDVQILHCNSLKADILGGLAGRILGIPVIWHVRDRIADNYLPKGVAQIFRLLAKTMPNFLIANSASTLFTIQGNSTNPKRAVVLDGVRTQDFTPRQNSSRPMEPLKILLIGRISPWKGQHIFIKAAQIVDKQFPGMRFQIAGSALFGEQDYEHKMHMLVKELSLEESIEFLGFVSNVPELIASADIVVHASTIGEPFGQVIAEAMAGGKPVVATAGGGVPEILDDGVTGILVPMNDHESMASAISRLISEPDLRANLGKAAHAQANVKLSMELVANNIQDIYGRIIGWTNVSEASAVRRF